MSMVTLPTECPHCGAGAGVRCVQRRYGTREVVQFTHTHSARLREIVLFRDRLKAPMRELAWR